MRRVLSLMAFSAMFAMLALGASWSGKLIDAACHDQQKTACDATSATTTFALDVSGKVYKLDSAGNTKAAQAVKNRADRSDPAKPKSTAVMANVTGQESAGTITVETVEVQ